MPFAAIKQPIATNDKMTSQLCELLLPARCTGESVDANSGQSKLPTNGCCRRAAVGSDGAASNCPVSCSLRFVSPDDELATAKNALAADVVAS